MKLQQLLYVVEVFKQGLNISLASKILQTSQPGISKQIRQLESELGVQIFERYGKHLTKVTEAGHELIQIAFELLARVDNLKSVAFEHTYPDRGALTIVATNNQLRYQLPGMISDFVAQYPQVSLHVYQNRHIQIIEALAKGQADFALTYEVSPIYDSLLLLPCYHWELVGVVPHGHPLAKKRRLSLEELKGYPLITYPSGFFGNGLLSNLFELLASQVVLTATDSDLLKTYVRLGLGVGIIGKMVLHPQLDRDLVSLDARDFLPLNTTKIGFLRGKFFRGYMLAFIASFAPHLTKEVIEMAIAQPNNRAVEAMFNSFQLPLK